MGNFSWYFYGGLVWVSFYRVIYQSQPILYKLHKSIISCLQPSFTDYWLYCNYSSILSKFSRPSHHDNTLASHKILFIMLHFFGTSTTSSLTYFFWSFNYYIGHMIWISSIIRKWNSYYYCYGLLVYFFWKSHYYMGHNIWIPFASCKYGIFIILLAF